MSTTTPATTRPFVIIAIDGGAATGKSTTSRGLSERFNLLHVDTGTFYRAIAAELLRRQLAPADTDAIRAALPALSLGSQINARSALMEINGRPIDPVEIRSEPVNKNVAPFASIPEVRALLLDYQRDFARVAREHGFNGLVMDGRDIGSKIFPDADFRFILEADIKAREQRRLQEGQQDQIARRDDIDLHRVRANEAGAMKIDTTFTPADKVIAMISALVLEKLK